AVIIGVAIAPVEEDLIEAFPLLRIGYRIPQPLPRQVKVIHVGPPDQAVGALDIVAHDIGVYLVIIFGADNDHGCGHRITVGGAAVELVIGILTHVPTERPRAVIVIGHNNVAPANGTLADRIDLPQRAFNVRR